MRKALIPIVMSVLFSIPSLSQNVNTDSIKAEMDKIEITNQGMKQVIENYKKGVIKGDLESMNLLGMECLSGKYVKTNLEIGLNLLDAAASNNYVDAQFNLGDLYFLFWNRKPENSNYFVQGTKWLKKAVKGGNNKATILLARFYFEYGKYKNEIAYIDGGIQMLESYPKVSEVNHKDEQVLNAQAWLGNMCLCKWRMEKDSDVLRDAKKWYRLLLRSDLEFPNFTPYIDSLKVVLSMGVPMRIDPQPTEEQISESQNSGGMGGFGGFGGGFGGFGGGFGGQPQGPSKPQAKFLGGNMEKMQFIRNNTHCPENVKNLKGNGKEATVSFTVDTDGAIIFPEISKQAVVAGVNIYIMDQEALRTIMVMPDWIPAEENGQPVQAQHSETISFGSGGMRY